MKRTYSLYKNSDFILYFIIEIAYAQAFLRQVFIV